MITHTINKPPRAFEVLLYRIFSEQIKLGKDITKGFDNVDLMSGVAEKGLDCVLNTKGKITGTIQCKRVAKNLNEKTSSKEIIKFVINSIHHKYLGVIVTTSSDSLCLSDSQIRRSLVLKIGLLFYLTTIRANTISRL